MANNRMWLHCEWCGEQILIAKYYPTWFNAPRSEWGWGERQVRPLDVWLHEHTHIDGIDLNEFNDGPEHFHVDYDYEGDEGLCPNGHYIHQLSPMDRARESLNGPEPGGRGGGGGGNSEGVTRGRGWVRMLLSKLFSNDY